MCTPESQRRYVLLALLGAAGCIFYSQSGNLPAAEALAPPRSGFGSPVLQSRAPPVFADGTGLPAGAGSPAQGAVLYADQCAACHGAQGQGGTALELTGDASLLATEYPDRGIAVYWPNAPALFEYVQRAMPPSRPGSLSDDEAYAIVAHLLVLNGLIDDTDVVNADLLGALLMPNRGGFIDQNLPDQ